MPYFSAMPLLQVTDIFDSVSQVDTVFDLLIWIIAVQFVMLVSIAIYFVVDKREQIRFMRESTKVLSELGATINHIFQMISNRRNP